MLQYRTRARTTMSRQAATTTAIPDTTSSNDTTTITTTTTTNNNKNKRDHNDMISFHTKQEINTNVRKLFQHLHHLYLHNKVMALMSSVPTTTVTATSSTALPAAVSKNNTARITKNVHGTTTVHDAKAKRQYHTLHQNVDNNAIRQTKKGTKKKIKLQQQQQQQPPRTQDVQQPVQTQVPIQVVLPYEATKVSYGFKAPVTLLLLPVLIAHIDDYIQVQQRKQQVQQQGTNANHNTSNSNSTSTSNSDNTNNSANNSPKVKFIHVVRE